jgi:hypothetical protein
MTTGIGERNRIVVVRYDFYFQGKEISEKDLKKYIIYIMGTVHTTIFPKNKRDTTVLIFVYWPVDAIYFDPYIGSSSGL